MKHFICATFMLLAEISGARALEPDPNQFTADSFGYHIPAVNFLGSNIPRLLGQGAILGIVDDQDTAGLSSPSQIKGYFASLSAASRTRGKAIATEITHQISNTPVPAPPAAPADLVQTPAVDLGSPLGAKLDFKSFRNCANSMLPLVRMAIALAGRHDSGDAAEIVRDQLNENRYDGTKTSPLGTICGKYLGSLASETTSLTQDAKILMTLRAARSDAEQDALLTTFVAAFHRDSTVMGDPLWMHYWAAQGLAAVFRKSADTALPSLADLMGQITDAEMTPPAFLNSPNFSVQGAFVDKKAVTDRGLNFAKARIEAEKAR